jgi:tRNA threonylcarbamoyl adenosine modification protein YeaZ
VRRLVIDTATPACSVALFEGDSCLASAYEEIGRGHAERLVPMIAALPEKGRADQLHVNVGPGSFTGIRVGISAARALALAWGVPCHGYGCLALVAAIARGQDAVDVDAVMTGGHGEVFFQCFDGQGLALDAPVSLPLETAAAQSKAERVGGDMAEPLLALRGFGDAVSLLPDARAFLAVAAMPPLPPSACYARAPDAKLPGGIVP